MTIAELDIKYDGKPKKWDDITIEKAQNRPLVMGMKKKTRHFVKYVFYFDENGILHKETPDYAIAQGVKDVYYSKSAEMYYLSPPKLGSIKFPDETIALLALNSLRPGASLSMFLDRCRSIEKTPAQQRRMLFETKICDHPKLTAVRDEKGVISRINIVIPLCYSDMDKACAFVDMFYKDLKRLCIWYIRLEFSDTDPKDFLVQDRWISKSCCFGLTAVRR